jgi:ATP phosphoribosyltransferase regulatory subunit
VLLDLALPRRHAYYDGMVFHGYVEGGGEAVVTGGRYDALMRRFGLDWGAAGFAVNVDTLATRQLAKREESR